MTGGYLTIVAQLLADRRASNIYGTRKHMNSTLGRGGYGRRYMSRSDIKAYGSDKYCRCYQIIGHDILVCRKYARE
jgi:hypothetical protein